MHVGYMHAVILNLNIMNVLVIANNVSLFVRDTFANFLSV